jgi:NAD(P)-dependent dehydrogenase (short-subunit alcohol dehydrogenase family)
VKWTQKNPNKGLFKSVHYSGYSSNSLAPGFIDTPIIPEESKTALASITPMQRLGKAEEMAKAVLFMASDDSSFMTGNTLTVDGGYTAQ